MREHRIRANGLTHYVRDSGDEAAPVALLLHGFPDSADMWTPITPTLVAAGYRVIAPDLRGFGRTDMAAHVDDYLIRPAILSDVIAILDALNIDTAHVVGHDFGAPVAWALAAQHAPRCRTLAALSVGHPRAYLSAGLSQKLKSWYIVMHQVRGVCEWLYRRDDWALLRKHWSKHGDIDGAVALLARPGRLTAGLNWYRANFSLRSVAELSRSAGDDIVRIPTIGVWSDGDRYLAEDQMTGSARYVEAPWRYERIDGASHWISYDAPERLAALLAGHWRTHDQRR